jgi:hypothetical protein
MEAAHVRIGVIEQREQERASFSDFQLAGGAAASSPHGRPFMVNHRQHLGFQRSSAERPMANRAETSQSRSPQV